MAMSSLKYDLYFNFSVGLTFYTVQENNQYQQQQTKCRNLYIHEFNFH